MGILFAALSGLFVGYIINYLSDVLPIYRAITKPNCIYCETPIGIKDYLTISACKNCGKARSWRTYIVLAAGILLSIVLWVNPPIRMGYWFGVLVLGYLGLVVVIDLEHRLILHVVSLSGAIIGVIVGSIRYNLPTSLVGGMAGLLVMLLFYGFGILFARFRAKRGYDDGEEALGFGDVTISTVLGLMLGWPFILYGLMFGILVGGVFSLLLVLVLILLHKYEPMTVFTAYGPYLVIGAIILLYFPQYLPFLSGN